MKNHYLKQWNVESESSPRTYIVSLRSVDGMLECSCPAWTRSMPRKPCKHIKKLYKSEGRDVEAAYFAYKPKDAHGYRSRNRELIRECSPMEMRPSSLAKDIYNEITRDNPRGLGDPKTAAPPTPKVKSLAALIEESAPWRI